MIMIDSDTTIAASSAVFDSIMSVDVGFLICADYGEVMPMAIVFNSVFLPLPEDLGFPFTYLQRSAARTSQSLIEISLNPTIESHGVPS